MIDPRRKRKPCCAQVSRPRTRLTEVLLREVARSGNRPQHSEWHGRETGHNPASSTVEGPATTQRVAQSGDRPQHRNANCVRTAQDTCPFFLCACRANEGFSYLRLDGEQSL